MPSMATVQSTQNGQSARLQDTPAENGVGESGDEATASSPTKSPAKGWIPVKGSTENPPQRLDLS